MPGGDQIVNQQYALAMRNRITMNFDLVGTVFECIGHTQCFVGQLAFLAHWHETRV